MRYQFIISKNGLSFEVSLEDAAMTIIPLPPRNDYSGHLIAKTLKATGEAFLVRQIVTRNAGRDLIQFYIKKGYTITSRG